MQHTPSLSSVSVSFRPSGHEGPTSLLHRGACGALSCRLRQVAHLTVSECKDIMLLLGARFPPLYSR